MPASLVYADTCGEQQAFLLSEAPSGEYSLLVRVQSNTQPAGEEAETVYEAQGSIDISIEEEGTHSDLEILLSLVEE